MLSSLNPQDYSKTNPQTAPISHSLQRTLQKILIIIHKQNTKFKGMQKIFTYNILRT